MSHMSHAINCPIHRGEDVCICSQQTTGSVSLPYKLRNGHSHRLDGLAVEWGLKKEPCAECDGADEIERMSRIFAGLRGHMESIRANPETSNDDADRGFNAALDDLSTWLEQNGL
jgi:hypothetical protein